ncbi:MAG TPA: triphosphoribosyl-dephospho-CoA synthase [Gemmatimonadaceae bacterium]|nr:triphosphoribosyl-dephospho-CoA synthase [Gemmatimonadaceae bacterium]
MTNDFIASAAQLACLIEASAPKPGNVSPGRDFPDASYEDFLASAAAIGPALASELPLGATINAAIRATGQWTRSNTNLGMVLLLAPLARAARSSASSSLPLRDALHNVLASTTVEDAREVYAAIRLARPGGLGTVAEEDVAGEPGVALTDAMRMAADTDSIAAEYATDFRITFDIGLPTLLAAKSHGWEEATVRTYLALLAEIPDTHIARKFGSSVAADVSRRARGAVRAGPEGRAHFDEELRSAGVNPGTTADLTAAALYVALLRGR